MMILALIGLLGNTVSVFATEVPDEAPTATSTVDPVVTPTIPPAFYEPIQSNEIADWPQGPAVYAESAIVMDADTGTILYEKNIDEQKYPASITKIMTTLLAIEHSNPSDRVVFSDHAIYGIERASSHIGIRPGENLSMEDCLYAMMLASANEVCLAVAEHIGGDVDTFVSMMNAKAAELGCTNTNFTNPNGLPDENHYVSARDMALIAKAAFQNELFREVCSTKVHKIGWTNLTGEDRWFQNHHKMLFDDSDFYYEGCLGGKTGFTKVALRTLVTYANRDGRNLICVTLKTHNTQDFIDTATLLDYGFANFHNVTISNTKKADYSFYLLPFPSQLLRCYSPKTVNDLTREVAVSVPLEATADNLTIQTTPTMEVINRDIAFNEYVVGTDNIRQPAGISHVLSLSTTLASTASLDEEATGTMSLGTYESDESDKLNLIDSFESLPSWKWPMLGFLIVLLILIIVKLYFAIKRSKSKRRRKKEKKQANQ